MDNPTATACPPIVEGTFVTDDGVRLHYLDWRKTQPASSSANCCLLLHGFTNDAHIWDGLSSVLARHFRVIALDFRGHGDSAWDPKAEYTHPRLVLDVQQLVHHLGLKHFHLVGHSLGARVAALYIAQCRPDLSSVTLVDTGPEIRAAGVNKVRQDAESMPTRFPSVESYRDLLRQIYLLGEDGAVNDLAHFGLRPAPEGGFMPKTDPEFTRALWNPDSYKNDASDLRAPLDEQLWQALRHIQAPCLIVRGRLSAILSSRTAQRMINDYLPCSELAVIDKAGHAVMIDNPRDFIDCCSAFILRMQSILEHGPSN